ncbi:hypothetical protein Mgra_00006644 [Meloidogyne graminicola]|uniref:MAM domain-containing protein n=1 Tax=Meloidogyne graminicola TaxID=189291 RepID=A0A8S9ZL41_9BILA|nr:hypothetical protein Mgra_00006644 [Meloidogyne graminicola]
MEGTCLWNLGQGWKSDSHGSISIELILLDNSQIISALFRPPVASYIDFDLWLSNNVKFIVAEQIINNNNYLNEDYNGEEILKLFEREGATDGGWHRFRIPLRPSFLPVRLLFIVELILYSKKGINEEEGFVSLSNIKLVNNEGIEIGCQTIEDIKILKTTPPTTIPFIKEEENIKEYERKLLTDAGIQWLSKQPSTLPKLSTNEFNILPITSTFSSIIKQNTILRKGEPLKIQTKIFNPFLPLFEGIAPIIPQQNNPQRLTALMDKQNIQLKKHLLQQNNLFPQLISPFSSILQPFVKEENNLMENEKIIQNQQMLYEATPIGIYSNIEHEEEDEDEENEEKEKESLLPFGIKEERKKVFNKK